MVSLGQNLKMRKRCEKWFYDHIGVVVCKKLRVKTLNCEKTRAFWKWPELVKRMGKMQNAKCKMVSLGQKLKMPKRCKKRLKNHIRVVVCKKPLQKRPDIRKTRAFWKWPKFATSMGYSPCKMLSLGQNLKMRKRCEKRCYVHIGVVVCQKAGEKTPNSKKTRAFWKWPELVKRMGYSPCKMVSLGQKFKMPERCEKRL